MRRIRRGKGPIRFCTGLPFIVEGSIAAGLTTLVGRTSQV